MKLEFANRNAELQCRSVKAANKLFGGDAVLVRSLLARINALEQAETIKDIIVQPTYHFHKLTKKNGKDLEGYFAIDVKTRREQWRIIMQPLDNDKKPYVPCNIDEIAGIIKIVEIAEVSKNYE